MLTRQRPLSLHLLMPVPIPTLFPVTHLKYSRRKEDWQENEDHAGEHNLQIQFGNGFNLPGY